MPPLQLAGRECLEFAEAGTAGWTGGVAGGGAVARAVGGAVGGAGGTRGGDVDHRVLDVQNLLGTEVILINIHHVGVVVQLKL